MARVERNLPIYLFETSKNYPTASMIDVVMESHRKADYTRGNSFPIIDTTGAFDRLYSEFFSIAAEEFGPLELDPRSIRTCWGYVTNKDFYKGGIHHHLRSSTINGVYYLSVPSTETAREGSISFYNDAHQEIYNIKPKAGDLVIFPNYLHHQPHQSRTEEYRIAVNMEIICKDIWRNVTT